MFKHIKPRILAMIIVSVFIVLLFLKCASYEKLDSICLHPDEITDSFGYNIRGTLYEKTEADSGFIISGYFPKTYSFTIKLNAPVKEACLVQIFYAVLEEDFSEKNAITVKMKKGEDELTYRIPQGDYNRLRIDIDTDFDLNSVSLNVLKTAWHLSPVILALLILVCILIADLMIYFDFLKIITGISSILHGIYLFGCRKKITIEGFFLASAIVMGMICSVLIAPGLTSDEANHLRFTFEELGLEGYYEEVCSYYSAVDEENALNGYAGIDIKALKSHMTDRFSDDCSLVPKPSILLIRHLPAAIGLYLGILLHLPVFFCLTLGEIFAVFFYAFMGYLALKRIPVLKELLCCIMLLPLTIMQCASLNYDCVSMPMMFFFSAYLFYLFYEKEKFSWKDLAILLICLLPAALIKPPFLLTAFLILLVPKEKWNLKLGKKTEAGQLLFKYWYLWTALLLVLVAAGLYVLRNFSYGMILIACIKRPLVYLKLLKRTLAKNLIFYAKSAVGHLGRRDLYLPEIIYFVILWMLFLMGQKKTTVQGKNFRIKLLPRLAMLLVFFAIMICTITILFSWNFELKGIYILSVEQCIEELGKIAYGLGTQGRYFTPVLLFLPAAFQGLTELSEENTAALQIVYYPCIFITLIITLVCDIWI